MPDPTSDYTDIIIPILFYNIQCCSAGIARFHITSTHKQYNIYIPVIHHNISSTYQTHPSTHTQLYRISHLWFIVFTCPLNITRSYKHTYTMYNMFASKCRFPVFCLHCLFDSWMGNKPHASLANINIFFANCVHLIFDQQT